MENVTVSMEVMWGVHQKKARRSRQTIKRPTYRIILWIMEKFKEEMDFAGPVRMSDVEDVQVRAVKVVRQLEQEGKVKVVRGDSKDKFV